MLANISLSDCQFKEQNNKHHNYGIINTLLVKIEQQIDSDFWAETIFKASV